MDPSLTAGILHQVNVWMRGISLPLKIKLNPMIHIEFLFLISKQALWIFLLALVRVKCYVASVPFHLNPHAFPPQLSH